LVARHLLYSVPGYHFLLSCLSCAVVYNLVLTALPSHPARARRQHELFFSDQPHNIAGFGLCRSRLFRPFRTLPWAHPIITVPMGGCCPAASRALGPAAQRLSTLRVLSIRAARRVGRRRLQAWPCHRGSCTLGEACTMVPHFRHIACWRALTCAYPQHGDLEPRGAASGVMTSNRLSGTVTWRRPLGRRFKRWKSGAARVARLGVTAPLQTSRLGDTRRAFFVASTDLPIPPHATS